jgi:hypothetical protein
MDCKKKLIFIAALFLLGSNVWAHGYVGKRFFPSAISQDEPFINDKLALPIFFDETTSAGNQSIWTTNPKLEYAKTITKNFQASVTASYSHIVTSGQKALNGFDNWETGVRYNIFLLPEVESIFSIALNTKIGGSGNHAVNTPQTTLSPELLFAQGLGPLPEVLKFLRPLGFSLSLSPNITTSNYTVGSLSWGIAVEYSLAYLQQSVANFNLPLVDHIVPIVELPFTTCTQGNCHGRTTGFIDPGVIIYGTYGQLGLEAIIPSNRNTGNQVGGVIQFYLYLDKLMPNSLGKPLIDA